MRVASILLLLAFALLGTGSLQRLHDMDHAIRDRAADAADASHAGHHHHHHGHDEEPVAPLHGDWDCHLHAVLNGPLVSASAVPALILLGLFVAFLTLLRSLPVSRLAAMRLDCRGPPISC